MDRDNKKAAVLPEIIVAVMALLCLIPFYFLLVNSLKPIKEILVNPVAFPEKLYFGNFISAFKILNYPKAFLNSVIVTVTTNAALVLVGSMAGYRLVRHNTKMNKFLFLLFIAAMVIPFQSIMIPMVVVASKLGFINKYYGVLFVYLGFGVSFTIFLFHGFIKSIPVDIEEAAVVDGCSPYGVFFRIVFPLLKPIIATVIVLNGLWTWNDFLLPLLIIPAENMRTLPLAINSFFSQYTKQWDMAIAALIMSFIPIIILFLLMQKYIIEGIVAGSVKG